MASATLVLKREHQVMGLAVSFELYVNNELTGYIRRGENLTFLIPTGTVTIQMKSVGKQSEVLTITNIDDGDQIIVGCRIKANVFTTELKVWNEGIQKHTTTHIPSPKLHPELQPNEHSQEKDIERELRRINDLFNKNLIDEDEYKKLKHKILGL